MRDAWSRIRPARRTPMQHWIWNEASFAAFYPNDACTVVFDDIEATPRAAAAFGAPARASPRAFLAGAEENGEPVEPVYADAEAAARLADRIARMGRAVRFGHFPQQSDFLAAFGAAARGRGLLLRRPVAGSPYIALHEGWRDPLSQFPSGRRSDLRRMMRKAEKLGAVAFQIIAARPDEVNDLLDEAIRVESRSWKSRTKTSIADNERQHTFYRAYAPRAAAEGILRFGRMTINGQTVAVQLAVECDGAYWLYKIGYDESFGACSPGNLMMLESIRHAAEQGLLTFEFLGKAADWTRAWTTDERPNVALRYYPFTLSGAVALFGDGLEQARARAWRLIGRSAA